MRFSLWILGQPLIQLELQLGDDSQSTESEVFETDEIEQSPALAEFVTLRLPRFGATRSSPEDS